MKTALVTIATGSAYREYARGLHYSALRYFPQAEFVLFSDHDHNPGVDKWFHTDAKGHPFETLYRYHTLLKEENELMAYDQIFWVDADMLFVDSIGDIFSKGITATLHPGYVGRKGTPELRKESAAYCPDASEYYCGGFIGGYQPAFLHMAWSIRSDVDIDTSNNIVAIWNDESHEQRYLFEHPPAKVLSPSYCYPEDYAGQWGWQPGDFKPILLALNKRKRQGRG